LSNQEKETENSIMNAQNNTKLVPKTQQSPSSSQNRKKNTITFLASSNDVVLEHLWFFFFITTMARVTSQTFYPAHGVLRSAYYEFCHVYFFIHFSAAIPATAGDVGKTAVCPSYPSLKGGYYESDFFFFHFD